MDKLRFDLPAADWNEGLPIGNGTQGAMLFGTPQKLQIQCNEDTIWQGGFRDRNNPNSLQALPEIRELIFAGKMKEAENLITESMLGAPEFQRIYQPAGTIFLENMQKGELTAYQRELDLETAVASEEYQIGEATFKSESYASFPHQVMVYHLRAAEKGQKVRIQLNRLQGLYDQAILEIEEDQGIVGIKGNTGNGGVDFVQLCRVQTDGELALKGQFLLVTDFRELKLTTTIATSFRYEDAETEGRRRLSAMPQDWQDLKAEHIQDYQGLYQTMQLQLGAESDKKVPTLLAEVQAGDYELKLVQLMFQFGRYLLIACSRPGSLPANLQGIWNKEMAPSWDSKYTININTEMNYWPAEKTGLGECHQALFEHLVRMYPNGQQTAKVMYGLEGFVTHHNTDLWGDCAPADDWPPSTYWPFGALWLTLHIWEHYLYTNDREFLQQYFYLMEESLRFNLDYLISLPNGDLVTCPSLSPENSFYTESGEEAVITYGASMDTQIIWEAIQNYLAAVDYVDHDEALVAKAQEALKHLPKPQVGQYGQLQEWYEDYREAEPGHRHVSHLFGVFPGHMLEAQSLEIKQAARHSLERRLANGGGHTGWSAAWLINLWAHFEEGDQAGEVITKQLRNSTLPNLLDNHPPFQIDGNFGFTSGVMEMLVQYYDEELRLLPALPSNWCEGTIRGVCLPHQVKLDLSWKDGEVDCFTVHGELPMETEIVLSMKQQKIRLLPSDLVAGKWTKG